VPAKPRLEFTLTVVAPSMEPTLHCAKPRFGCRADIADVIVGKTFAGPAKRGDILVFRAPPLAVKRCAARGVFIKRVVGVPGEVVEERQGRIYANGHRLAEPYVLADERDRLSGKWRVGAGYFVLGDNRVMSCDSRQWGSVPRAAIVGKVVSIRRPK